MDQGPLKTAKLKYKMRMNRRAALIAAIISIAFLGIMFRIWYFQSEWGDEYSRLAVRQVTAQEAGRVQQVNQPRRGVITDRNLQPIANSTPVYTVAIDILRLGQRRNTNDRDFIEEALSDIQQKLGIPASQLRPLFARDADGNTINRSQWHIIARNVPANIALPLAEAHREIHTEETTLRSYPDPFFAPQIVGFQRGDASWGIEAHFNDMLTGDIGRTFMSAGAIEEIPVRDGFAIVTTLDADIQRIVQRKADDTFARLPAENVGIIVMAPHTGEILAMAQAPSFSLAEPDNPEFFSHVPTQSAWEALTDHEQTNHMMQVWRNFHTTRSFEPGSIFKPIVIAAAYEEGLVNLHSTFHCDWFRQIHDQRIWCWRQWGHGNLTLREVLYRSCNVGMIDIMNLLGRDTFYRYRGYFGFGERTGIDLPGESAVNSPAVMYSLDRLRPVELATSSMGQGFNATSIQAITAFAALINGGYMMQPFLVSQVIDANGNLVEETRPTVVRRAISQETSDFIRREMQTVIDADAGTGRATQIPGHSIGGKTGTAQQGNRDLNIHTLTYIAYTPVENPEFLILMVIDHIYNPVGQFSAGNTIAPIVRELFQELITMRNLPPTDGDVTLNDWHVMRDGVELVPDFSGRRAVDVVRDLNNMTHGGYQFFPPIGGGSVVTHTIPAAGRPMPQNTVIFIHTDVDSRLPGQMVSVPDVRNMTVDQASVFLADGGLTTVLFMNDRDTERPETNSVPGTWGAEDAANGVVYQEPQPMHYIVSQQFPAPGTEVERGMQVMLRVTTN